MVIHQKKAAQHRVPVNSRLVSLFMPIGTGKKMTHDKESAVIQYRTLRFYYW
jgi:hypothetical protein